MKKFLALMFVCAGLTAMAGVPQINKADLASVKGQKVMKANNLTKEFAAPVMNYGKDVMSPRKVMKDLNMSFNDNRLSRKAPRRLSDADVAANKYIDFRYCSTISSDGNIVEDDWYYRGGQGVYMQIDNNQLWCAGIYWNKNTGSCYYLPLNIDYNTGVVELPPIGVLDDDTISGKKSATATPQTYTDTVDFSYLLDANYVFDVTDEPSSIYGQIYDDGTIEFNDTLPYVFAGYRALLTYTRSGNPFTGYSYTLTKADTTEFVELYYGTQFIVPNATHTYELYNAGNTTPYEENAFMFQANDTTAIVFNLYGMGMPGNVMNIYPDGTMKYPIQQIGELGTPTKEYYANYYGSAYNWDNTKYYWIIGMNFDETANDYVEVDDSVFVGTVEPTAIKWDAAEYYLPGIVRVSDGAQMSLSSYPFINNVLAFTDGSEFILNTEPQFIVGDVNKDGKVTIDDVAILIDHLLAGDIDESDEFSPDAADVDGDGEVLIGDLSVLIDQLLQG